ESQARVWGTGELVAKRAGPDDVAELPAERLRIEWLSGAGVPGPSVVDRAATDDGARRGEPDTSSPRSSGAGPPSRFSSCTPSWTSGRVRAVPLGPFPLVETRGIEPLTPALQMWSGVLEV